MQISEDDEICGNNGIGEIVAFDKNAGMSENDEG